MGQCEPSLMALIQRQNRAFFLQMKATIPLSSRREEWWLLVQEGVRRTVPLDKAEDRPHHVGAPLRRPPGNEPHRFIRRAAQRRPYTRRPKGTAPSPFPGGRWGGRGQDGRTVPLSLLCLVCLLCVN